MLSNAHEHARTLPVRIGRVDQLETKHKTARGSAPLISVFRRRLHLYVEAQLDTLTP